MARLLIGIGMVLFALLGAVAVLEVGLRARGYSEPVWYRADPQLGWTLRPGAKGRYAAEGDAQVWISPAGMRDRTHTPAKPAGVYRIAVLGGAYAEAMQVDFRETFWWQLEERLAQCGFQPGKRVEVLNFGVRGYGAAQAATVLERRASRYAPDLVLLVLGGDADPDASRVRLVELPAPWRELAISASDRLRSAQFLIAQAQRYSEQGRLHAAPRAAGAKVEPWLAQMKTQAARRSAAFAVVIVPHPLQVHPDARLRRSPPELVRRQRALEAFGASAGIPMIALAEGMGEAAAAQGAHLHGFRNTRPGQGHWNALGHRTAAELIARRLCPSSTSH